MVEKIIITNDELYELWYLVKCHSHDDKELSSLFAKLDDLFLVGRDAVLTVVSHD